jgi:hypothetical protein
LILSNIHDPLNGPIVVKQNVYFTNQGLNGNVLFDTSFIKVIQQFRVIMREFL